jgi:hypothetical protein
VNTRDRDTPQKGETGSDSTVQKSLGGIPHNIGGEKVPQEIADALKTASDQGSSQFTVDSVLQGTEGKTEEEIQEALSDLEFRGIVYQPSAGTYKFI